MKMAVSGAAGAMGKRIVALATQTAGCQVVAALERADHPDLGKDAGILAGVAALGVALSPELDDARPDVLVDFSTPEAVMARARSCADGGIALVVGTTGLSAEQRAELEALGKRVPVLVSSNMSVGVNLLFQLVEQVARALSQGYDVEIVEAHHRRKKDAPSGTAMELGRRICRALDRDPEKALLYGREGIVGPRTPEEIAILAVRAGDIVGEHTVVFAATGERIELTHRASSRDVFAVGAIRAARFAAGRKPGVYTMADVLFQD